MMVLRSSFLWTTIDTPAFFLFRGAGGGADFDMGDVLWKYHNLLGYERSKSYLCK